MIFSTWCLVPPRSSSSTASGMVKWAAFTQPCRHPWEASLEKAKAVYSLTVVKQPPYSLEQDLLEVCGELSLAQKPVFPLPAMPGDHFCLTPNTRLKVQCYKSFVKIKMDNVIYNGSILGHFYHLQCSHGKRFNCVAPLPLTAST